MIDNIGTHVHSVRPSIVNSFLNGDRHHGWPMKPDPEPWLMVVEAAAQRPGFFVLAEAECVEDRALCTPGYETVEVDDEAIYALAAEFIGSMHPDVLDSWSRTGPLTVEDFDSTSPHARLAGFMFVFSWGSSVDYNGESARMANYADPTPPEASAMLSMDGEFADSCKALRVAFVAALNVLLSERGGT